VVVIFSNLIATEDIIIDKMMMFSNTSKRLLPKALSSTPSNAFLQHQVSTLISLIVYR